MDDAAFKKFIRQRNYQLVSAFDTISKRPVLVAARVMFNGKWLTIDNHGKIIADGLPVEPVHSGFSGGLSDIGVPDPSEASGENQSAYSIININGKYGTVDKKTMKIGLPADYDYIGFYMKGLLEIRKGDLTGLAMGDGRIIKPPQYQSIQGALYEFGKDRVPLIQVKKDGKYGMLNAMGEDILQPAYDEIRDCSGCDLKRQLLLIAKDNKYGIATKTGKIVIEPTYESITPLTFKGQMKISSGTGRDKKYGAIDSTGKVILEPVYSNLEHEYKNDYITIKTGKSDAEMEGIADINGKIILQPIYSDITEPGQGLWMVTSNRKQGIMNRAGLTVMEPLYDRLIIYPDAPYILAENNNKYGIFNLQGKLIVPIEYLTLIPGQKGFAFNKDNKWGIMNVKGHVISMLDYDRVSAAGGRYLLVWKDNKAGVIDTDGNMVIPVKYDRFFNEHFVLRQGLAKALLNGTVYFIDRYGNEYKANGDNL